MWTFRHSERSERSSASRHSERSERSERSRRISPMHGRTFSTAAVLAFLAFAAAFALALPLLPQTALADVQQGDYIGELTIAQRGGKVSDAPDVNATAAILESQNGTVLWSRNADEQVPMASTTKIMTCILAIENGDVDSEVTIPEEADSVGEASCYLEPGATCNFYDLLTAMMLKSGNDAAISAAVIISGSEEAFVELMNSKAEELGMTNTHFVNSHGLSAEGHYASARDFATLARYAMKNETFRSIVCQESCSFDLGSGPVEFTNGNTALFMIEGCIGIKTGTEDDAGYCVVTCTERKGVELYAVVFGSSEEADRFFAAQTLTEWGYKHNRTVSIEAGEVVARVQDSDWLDVRVPVKSETECEFSVLDYDGEIQTQVDVQDAHGNIRQGDLLGTLTYSQGGEVVATVRLEASADVDAPSLPERFAIWYLRTFRGLENINETLMEAQASISFS